MGRLHFEEIERDRNCTRWVVKGAMEALNATQPAIVFVSQLRAPPAILKLMLVSTIYELAERQVQ